AHRGFTDREVRDDRMLFLEQGQPMIFGKNRDMGLRLNGLRPEIVHIGEDGITEADVLVHDETSDDPTIHNMLARIYYPKFPVPVGVIRNVPRPTLVELIEAQVAEAVTRHGEGDLLSLLRSGETWTIE
ncbi:MAG: 2-oxoacid:ferredoxin oxidoreductase subunit beta, partial [Chloroflexota bacterium]